MSGETMPDLFRADPNSIQSLAGIYIALWHPGHTCLTISPSMGKIDTSWARRLLQVRE